MRRVIQHADWEAVRAVLDELPEPIRNVGLETHWFLRCDPVFSGLHDYTDTGDGRSYRDTSHCVYGGVHTEHTTIVLAPDILSSADFLRPAVLHELGHAVHERLEFRGGFVPMTWYGETNEREAFAESFQAWHTVHGDGDVFMDREHLCSSDPGAWTFFDYLDRYGPCAIRWAA